MNQLLKVILLCKCWKLTLLPMNMSRYELVLDFKFNNLYIISENISHLGVFEYRVGAAILCELSNLQG